MSFKQSSPAIIINRQAYRDNDLLVNLYSKNFGRLTLLARGAKKINSKLAAHLEPLSLVDILIIPGRGNFNYLASAVARDFFIPIRGDWHKAWVAGQILALFDKSIKEGQADINLFNYLSAWLESLSSARPDQGNEFNREEAEIYFVLFLIRFLDLLGYRPHLDNCLVCNSKLPGNQYFFSLDLGGSVCLNCRTAADREELKEISGDCLKLWRFLQTENKPIIIKRRLIKELRSFLLIFFQYRLT